MNILITGGKNAKASRLLKAFKDDFIILGDYDEMPSLSTATYRTASFGKKLEESVAHVLLDFCLSQSIDVLIPTYLFEIEQVAKAIQLFSEYGIEVLLPKPADLADYLIDGNFANAALLVVKKESVLYSSAENAVENMPKDLNGVFNYELETGKIQLFLV